MMRIFLGSSKEAERFVDFTKLILDRYGLTPVPWNDPALWPGGSYLLENLFKIVENTDGAILFMYPDDRVWYRDKERYQARDNLTFEAGLFLAAHGRKRVAIIAPIKEDKTGERFKAELPSDLAGVTYTGFVVAENQDAAQTDLPNVLRRVAEGMHEPRKQFSEFGLTFQDDQLKPLLGHPRVRVFHLLAAPWAAIADPGIAELLRTPGVKEIDILVAYRLNRIIAEMAGFRMDRSARMRVCLADMFDDELARVYLRKYGDPVKRDLTYLQNGIVESVREILLGEEHADEWAKIGVRDGKLEIGELEHAPEAQIEIYLINQRITFSYYRAGDIAWVIPLDIKKAKDPSPYAYALSRSRSGELFDYYLHQEFNQMIEEARCVYPRGK